MNKIKTYLNNLYGKKDTSAYPAPIETNTFKDKVSELPDDVLEYARNDVLAIAEFYADTDSIKVNK